MKALVLAAGIGTRMLPHTRYLPKPLFPVGGRPLLDIHIRRLADAGCEAILVNTHHLADRIESFIATAEYPIPVATRFEPEILGTGGAIRNAADFWDDRPFMVINGDILTDIDLRAVYDFHLRHSGPATLAVCPDPEFDSVFLTRSGVILGFGGEDSAVQNRRTIARTFTGIQVLNPEVLDFIPEGVPASSIDGYRQMVSRGMILRAFIADGCDWHDLGAPARYGEAVLRVSAPCAFRSAFPAYGGETIRQTPLAGDGSDRRWRRLSASVGSLIVADHGIRGFEPGSREVDACIDIGRHLFRKGIPVPEIHFEDRFSGLVFMEDLGDIHLQSRVRDGEPARFAPLYEQVIEDLVRFGTSGREGFDPDWAWQSRAYDRSLILEKECRYFVEAFLVGYLGKRVEFRDFETEFEAIADGALQYGVNGLIHRDMQSRNIMVRNDGRCAFIDFQGARFGPLQYDLASLLIDPYAGLSASFQNRLSDTYIDRLSACIPLDREGFRRGYEFCALARNLQILGAFGFLSRIKGKTAFEKFIPKALAVLQARLHRFRWADLPGLTEWVSALAP